MRPIGFHGIATSSLPTPLCRDVAARREGAFEVRDTLHSAGVTYARHDHEHPSLFVVLSGRVDDACAKARTGAECTVGWMGYLPAAVEHESAFGNTHVHTVDVALDARWMERCGIDFSRLTQSVYASGAPVSAIAHRLLRACRQPDAGRALAVEELLVMLMTHAIDDAGGASSIERRPAWLDDIVERLHSRATAGDDLSTLSDNVGRDPAHVCRSFRKSLGCTVFEYARMVRVERAGVLLRTTLEPLSRIACQTGFSDQAHLTRVFRRQMGVTPGVYRRSAR